jgi:hypothetical protein
MAHPAIDRVRGTASLLAVVGVALVLAAAPSGLRGGERPDTRPLHLDRAAVERAVAAFGIAGEPERTREGWEAEDELQTLYLARAPSAWYVQYLNSAPLLGPAGDRATICAAPDAPYGCTVPDVEFVADVGGVPPGERDAAAAARRVLRDSGLLPGEWDELVLEPSRDAVPCRTGLVTPFPCTRQVVPSRAVMLTRELGDAPAARWGVIVGPRGVVLSAVGRVAVER